MTKEERIKAIEGIIKDVYYYKDTPFRLQEVDTFINKVAIAIEESIGIDEIKVHNKLKNLVIQEMDKCEISKAISQNRDVITVEGK